MLREEDEEILSYCVRKRKTIEEDKKYGEEGESLKHHQVLDQSHLGFYNESTIINA